MFLTLSVKVYETLKELISDLATRKVYVFCITADNASAFQKAGTLLQAGECSGGEEEEEAVEIDDSEFVPEAMQQFASEGIFCVRCALHSLQLV